MAAIATAISVFFVGDAKGVAENLMLHSLLAEHPLKLAHMTLSAGLRSAYDLSSVRMASRFPRRCDVFM